MIRDAVSEAERLLDAEKAAVEGTGVSAGANRRELVQAAMAVHRSKQTALGGLDLESRARLRALAEVMMGGNMPGGKGKKVIPLTDLRLPVTIPRKSSPESMSVNPPRPRTSWPMPFLQGERRALARAITLIESTRPDHQGAGGSGAGKAPASCGPIHPGGDFRRAGSREIHFH